MHQSLCQPEEKHPWGKVRLQEKTGWGFHEDIQPVPVLVGCPTLLEVVCHRPSAQKTNHHQFQWLQASSFDPCGDEVLIRNHIMSFTSTAFNPYQFAYRDNRSTDVTAATALHAVLSHWPHSTCLWAMSPPTGMRWSIWQCGVENTTCSCTMQKPRGLLWTSASWESESVRIWSGKHALLRRKETAFWAFSQRITSLKNCWCPSIAAQ